MQDRYHVLHIDDDLFIKRIIQQILSPDFDLTFCDNGMEAMIWLEQGHQPDIILTDLQMPLLGGQEFITMVRKSSLYRDVPILVLSASDDSALRVNCIDQGADDFVVKPFNPMEIKAKIKALLRRTSKPLNLRPTFNSTVLKR